MIFEVLTFSLYSGIPDSSIEIPKGGPKIDYEWEKWLWLAALVFHYSFLVIFLEAFQVFCWTRPRLCSPA